MSKTLTQPIRSIGAYEAKTNLGQILTLVEQGSSIRITRKSKCVALLVPDHDAVIDPSVFERIEQFRSRHKLPKGVTTKDLVNEGRRI